MNGVLPPQKIRRTSSLHHERAKREVFHDFQKKLWSAE